MKYFADVPHYFANPKNKLEEAVQASILEYQDFIFDIKTLPVVKSSIINVINQLNIDHSKRCKEPIKARWEEETRVSDKVKERRKGHSNWHLHLSGSVYRGMTLRICREESDL